MTKIKLCGLSRPADIECANELCPDYVGFVFAKGSRRYVTPEQAKILSGMLHRDIQAVGVFVDEDADTVVRLLSDGIIDIAQLHGHEDEAYIKALRTRCENHVIRAFRMTKEEDAAAVMASSADFVLLDPGAGDGRTFDWSIAKQVTRPFFLAGGLDCDNVRDAVRALAPYAVDVSSGIETDGVKDPDKMKEFARLVRSC